MRAKRIYFSGPLLAAMVLALGLAASASASPNLRDRPAPASGQCGGAAGAFGWDTIWRFDTSLIPGSQGYICTFPGAGEGGSATEESLANTPALHGWRNLCENVYRGDFYLFEAFIGPSETLYAGFGCEWYFE
jgi:hypothetical protein